MHRQQNQLFSGSTSEARFGRTWKESEINDEANWEEDSQWEAKSFYLQRVWKGRCSDSHSRSHWGKPFGRDFASLQVLWKEFQLKACDDDAYASEAQNVKHEKILGLNNVEIWWDTRNTFKTWSLHIELLHFGSFFYITHLTAILLYHVREVDNTLSEANNGDFFGRSNLCPQYDVAQVN